MKNCITIVLSLFAVLALVSDAKADKPVTRSGGAASVIVHKSDDSRVITTRDDDCSVKVPVARSGVASVIVHKHVSRK
mgnify:CR=1 FL=1